MKDIVKTQNKSQIHSKVKRKRKRNMSIYYLIVFFIVLVIGAVLSMTVLFNATAIEVEGETVYSNEQIIDVSGLKIGDNMIRMRGSEVSKQIIEQLVYVEEVDIQRKLPDKIIIKVQPSVPSASLKVNDGFLILSNKGKILEKSDNDQSLITISGFYSENSRIGTMVSSSDEEKKEILKNTLVEISNQDLNNIREIDVTDIYNVKLNYEDRITIELGNTAEIDYKIAYAKTLLTDSISNDERGYLLFLESNQASFVREQDMEDYKNFESQSEPISTETQEDDSENSNEEVTE